MSYVKDHVRVKRGLCYGRKHIDQMGQSIWLYLAYLDMADFKTGKIGPITDEKVAELHLAKIGVKLTKLTDKQSKYLGLDQKGPEFVLSSEIGRGFSQGIPAHPAEGAAG